MQQGDYRGAKQAYQQVLEITQKANAETDMAGALLNLGKSEIYLGDTAAESHLQKSIELAHRIEDHGDEGKARVLLGSLLQDAGKKQDANEQYTAAYDISAQAGDPDTQAYALSNLGQLALDNNDYPKAEEYLQSALDLRQKMNETDGVAKLQIRLADLFRSVQKISSARSLAEKARATAEKLGDMGTFADALCVLAEIDLSSGDYNAGLEKAAKAAKLYEEQKDTDGESQAHILSARALLAAHDRQKAAQEITFALALPGTTGATRDEAARISRDIQHGND
jgi:tetratricopeptide (TPR) repeat protein